MSLVKDKPIVEFGNNKNSLRKNGIIESPFTSFIFLIIKKYSGQQTLRK